jgi:hypothetical protein
MMIPLSFSAGDNKTNSQASVKVSSRERKNRFGVFVSCEQW